MPTPPSPFIQRLRRATDGPPPRLPRSLDRAAEWWAETGPRLRILVVGAATVLVLLVAGLGAARSPWGPGRPVLVATRHLPAGHVLADGDLATVAWPDGLLPEPLPTAPDEALGRALSAAVPSGVPVTAGHLDEGGLAADLGAGEVAVPVPVSEEATVPPGRSVDVLAGDGSGGGVRVAAGARVLTVDAGVAWLAVARDDAASVAGAATWGEVTLAQTSLTGP